MKIKYIDIKKINYFNNIDIKNDIYSIEKSYNTNEIIEYDFQINKKLHSDLHSIINYIILLNKNNPNKRNLNKIKFHISNNKYIEFIELIYHNFTYVIPNSFFNSGLDYPLNFNFKKYSFKNILYKNTLEKCINFINNKNYKQNLILKPFHIIYNTDNIFYNIIMYNYTVYKNIEKIKVKDSYKIKKD